MKEYTCTLINVPEEEPLIDLHAVGTPADFYELFAEALEGQDIFDDEDDWDIIFTPEDEDEKMYNSLEELEDDFQRSYYSVYKDGYNEYLASFASREEAIEYTVWKINDRENDSYIRRNLDINSTYGDYDIVFETEEGFDDE